jgi:hypothetical protein
MFVSILMNSQIWNEIMLELNGKPISCVTTLSSTDFFPSKTWFFGIYLNFQQQKSLLKSMSPTFWIQILPSKFHQILLVKIFPTTPKAHSNSHEIFSYDLVLISVKKSFNIQELLCTSPNVMEPKNQMLHDWHNSTMF